MDELTPEEIETLAESLQSLKREINASLAMSEEGARPVDLGESIGRISRVDAMQQQKMVAANRQSLIRRVQGIHAAIKRVEEGTYGLCLGCEDDSGLGRLTARPETPLCLDCQGQKEKRKR